MGTRVEWRGRRSRIGVAVAVAAMMLVPGTATAVADHDVLVSSLGSASGSTIGPDGALYVAQPFQGSITRVDRKTGATTMVASGLPLPLIGVGGVMDVEFVKGELYALVTLVGPDVGGSDVVGIYRIDGVDAFTPVVDLGTWSADHPPVPAFIVPTGVQYAMQRHGKDLIVTDGHHNRVLRVSLHGDITEIIAFGNTVPTGLDLRGGRIVLAKAGPVPHLPEDGMVVSFGLRGQGLTELAGGAPLMVDVEYGRGGLYGLAQGLHTSGIEGSPADADTGMLVRRIGSTLTPIAEAVDRPTSMEIVGDTAYVVTIDGEVWVYRNLSKRR